MPDRDGGGDEIARAESGMVFRAVPVTPVCHRGQLTSTGY